MLPLRWTRSYRTVSQVSLAKCCILSDNRTVTAPLAVRAVAATAVVTVVVVASAAASVVAGAAVVVARPVM